MLGWDFQIFIIQFRISQDGEGWLGLGDFIPVSLKKGERAEIEEMLTKLLRHYNKGYTKKEKYLREPKFKKSDMWRNGLRLYNDFTFSKGIFSNNPSKKNQIVDTNQKLQEIKEQLFRYIDAHLRQAKSDLEKLRKGHKLGTENINQLREKKAECRNAEKFYPKLKSEIKDIFRKL